eukprot:gnl/Chilomastix_cuspidata/1677.p1 GENE.gnl/Chilomastix_cuspidata/1677~~gnl/Chilomastix_cuspidata/1677.p1  ORF type:complete len:2536 (+),score=1001.08 gnl/Chilomastix_cuspidata/1677:59-7666(+)
MGDAPEDSFSNNDTSAHQLDFPPIQIRLKNDTADTIPSTLLTLTSNSVDELARLKDFYSELLIRPNSQNFGLFNIVEDILSVRNYPDSPDFLCKFVGLSLYRCEWFAQGDMEKRFGSKLRAFERRLLKQGLDGVEVDEAFLRERVIGEHELCVREIMARRATDDGFDVLVSWRSHPSDRPTWEAQDSVEARPFGSAALQRFTGHISEMRASPNVSEIVASFERTRSFTLRAMDACARITLELTSPLSSIQKLVGTSDEAKCATIALKLAALSFVPPSQGMFRESRALPNLNFFSTPSLMHLGGSDMSSMTAPKRSERLRLIVACYVNALRNCRVHAEGQDGAREAYAPRRAPVLVVSAGRPDAITEWVQELNDRLGDGTAVIYASSRGARFFMRRYGMFLVPRRSLALRRDSKKSPTKTKRKGPVKLPPESQDQDFDWSYLAPRGSVGAYSGAEDLVPPPFDFSNECGVEGKRNLASEAAKGASPFEAKGMHRDVRHVRPQVIVTTLAQVNSDIGFLQRIPFHAIFVEETPSVSDNQFQSLSKFYHLSCKQRILALRAPLSGSPKAHYTLLSFLFGIPKERIFATLGLKNERTPRGSHIARRLKELTQLFLVDSLVGDTFGVSWDEICESIFASLTGQALAQPGADLGAPPAPPALRADAPSPGEPALPQSPAKGSDGELQHSSVVNSPVRSVLRVKRVEEPEQPAELSLENPFDASPSPFSAALSVAQFNALKAHVLFFDQHPGLVQRVGNILEQKQARNALLGGRDRKALADIFNQVRAAELCGDLREPASPHTESIHPSSALSSECLALSAPQAHASSASGLFPFPDLRAHRARLVGMFFSTLFCVEPAATPLVVVPDVIAPPPGASFAFEGREFRTVGIAPVGEFGGGAQEPPVRADAAAFVPIVSETTLLLSTIMMASSLAGNRLAHPLAQRVLQFAPFARRGSGRRASAAAGAGFTHIVFLSPPVFPAYLLLPPLLLSCGEVASAPAVYVFCLRDSLEETLLGQLRLPSVPQKGGASGSEASACATLGGLLRALIPFPTEGKPLSPKNVSAERDPFEALLFRDGHKPVLPESLLGDMYHVFYDPSVLTRAAAGTICAGADLFPAASASPAAAAPGSFRFSSDFSAQLVRVLLLHCGPRALVGPHWGPIRLEYFEAFPYGSDKRGSASKARQPSVVLRRLWGEPLATRVAAGGSNPIKHGFSSADFQTGFSRDLSHALEGRGLYHFLPSARSMRAALSQSVEASMALPSCNGPYFLDDLAATRPALPEPLRLWSTRRAGAARRGARSKHTPSSQGFEWGRDMFRLLLVTPDPSKPIEDFTVRGASLSAVSARSRREFGPPSHQARGPSTFNGVKGLSASVSELVASSQFMKHFTAPAAKALRRPALFVSSHLAFQSLKLVRRAWQAVFAGRDAALDVFSACRSVEKLVQTDSTSLYNFGARGLPPRERRDGNGVRLYEPPPLLSQKSQTDILREKLQGLSTGRNLGAPDRQFLHMKFASAPQSPRRYAYRGRGARKGVLRSRAPTPRSEQIDFVKAFGFDSSQLLSRQRRSDNENAPAPKRPVPTRRDRPFDIPTREQLDVLVEEVNMATRISMIMRSIQLVWMPPLVVLRADLALPYLLGALKKHRAVPGLESAVTPHLSVTTKLVRPSNALEEPLLPAESGFLPVEDARRMLIGEEDTGAGPAHAAAPDTYEPNLIRAFLKNARPEAFEFLVKTITDAGVTPDGYVIIFAVNPVSGLPWGDYTATMLERRQREAQTGDTEDTRSPSGRVLKSSLQLLNQKPFLPCMPPASRLKETWEELMAVGTPKQRSALLTLLLRHGVSIGPTPRSQLLCCLEKCEQHHVLGKVKSTLTLRGLILLLSAISVLSAEKGGWPNDEVQKFNTTPSDAYDRMCFMRLLSAKIVECRREPFEFPPPLRVEPSLLSQAGGATSLSGARVPAGAGALSMRDRSQLYYARMAHGQRERDMAHFLSLKGHSVVQPEIESIYKIEKRFDEFYDKKPKLPSMLKFNIFESNRAPIIDYWHNTSREKLTFLEIFQSQKLVRQFPLQLQMKVRRIYDIVSELWSPKHDHILLLSLRIFGHSRWQEIAKDEAWGLGRAACRTLLGCSLIFVPLKQQRNKYCSTDLIAQMGSGMHGYRSVPGFVAKGSFEALYRRLEAMPMEEIEKYESNTVQKGRISTFLKNRVSALEAVLKAERALVYDANMNMIKDPSLDKLGAHVRVKDTKAAQLASAQSQMVFGEMQMTGVAQRAVASSAAYSLPRRTVLGQPPVQGGLAQVQLTNRYLNHFIQLYFAKQAELNPGSEITEWFGLYNKLKTIPSLQGGAAADPQRALSAEHKVLFARYIEIMKRNKPEIDKMQHQALLYAQQCIASWSLSQEEAMLRGLALHGTPPARFAPRQDAPVYSTTPVPRGAHAAGMDATALWQATHENLFQEFSKSLDMYKALRQKTPHTPEEREEYTRRMVFLEEYIKMLKDAIRKREAPAYAHAQGRFAPAAAGPSVHDHTPPPTCRALTPTRSSRASCGAAASGTP